MAPKIKTFFYVIYFFSKVTQSYMPPTFTGISGGNCSFTWSSEVPFQYLKTFVVTRCSTFSFVGSQFISLNSLAPI